MELKQLFADERAVSPVIGVILMVAITVILAAVIGTFVLGLGDQVQNTAPQASFTFDYDSNGGSAAPSYGGDGDLTITHDGGDKVESARLSVKDDDGVSNSGDIADLWGSGTSVSAGDSATMSTDSNDTIRVVWEASGGGDTATLGKWTGPDA